MAYIRATQGGGGGDGNYEYKSIDISGQIVTTSGISVTINGIFVSADVKRNQSTVTVPNYHVEDSSGNMISPTTVAALSTVSTAYATNTHKDNLVKIVGDQSFTITTGSKVNYLSLL